LEAITHLVSLLKVGTSLSSVYNETRDFIINKDPSLASALHKNFGFGIGFNHKEDSLAISATNETKIEHGMLFHVRITI
jgi:nucleosome binding factor SPN SPT16 subunit